MKTWTMLVNFPPAVDEQFETFCSPRPSYKWGCSGPLEPILKGGARFSNLSGFRYRRNRWLFATEAQRHRESGEAGIFV